jgi:membrane protease YdiL (CAAX protease family)
VAVFLVVAFGFTWVVSLPLVFSAPANVLPWYFYLGSFGPALGAIAATLVLRPVGGLGAWARRTFSFTGIRSALLVVVVSIILYFVAGLLVELLLNGSLDRLSSLGLTTKFPGTSVAVVLLIWVVTGGLGEETGWRGWLMPTLTQRFGFFAAAAMVAVVWGLWHLPQFLFNPGFQDMGWAVIGWAIALLAGSFWLGWIARLGKWSIIPVILWHGGFDVFTSSDLGPSTFAATISTIVIVQAVVVVIVLIVKRARSRGSSGDVESLDS